MGRVVIANILGARGPQGAKGDTGQAGPIGPRGPIGLTGPSDTPNLAKHTDLSQGWNTRWSGGGSAATAYSYPTGSNPGGTAQYVRKTWTSGGGTTNGDTGFDDHSGDTTTYWGASQVIPGCYYLASSFLRPSPGDKQGVVTMYWYDASGNFLSRTSGSSVDLASNAWTPISFIDKAPAGAATMWPSFDIANHGALWATGDTLDLARPIVNQLGLPGGFVDGNDLGTQDLNTFTNPGIYRQPVGTNATLARNYPITNGGILTVIRMNGPSYLIQEYSPLLGDSSSTGVVFRREMATTWGPWQAHVSSKWDGSRGIVQSDLTSPSAWTNLAYGPNWYDLDAGTWDQGAYRKDATGHVRFTGLIRPKNAIAPSDPNANNPNRWIGNIPVGFRPAKSMIFMCVAADSWCNVRFYNHAGDGYNPGDLVFWNQAASSDWVSLANISYYAP